MPVDITTTTAHLYQNSAIISKYKRCYFQEGASESCMPY